MLKITRRSFLWKSGLGALGAVTAKKSGFSDVPTKSLRFGLVADSHYADRPPQGTRYYRQSLDKMRQFVKVMNHETVDFVMHLGDFKDEDENKLAEDTLQYLNAMETVYAEFQGPRYHCVGNHDVDSITKDQFLQGIENTGIDSDKSYYSFDSGNVHCIVLDANYYDDGRDHFYKFPINFQDTNFPEKQLEWLSQDLIQNEGKPTLVFCHHPLFHFIRDQKQFHVNQFGKVQRLFKDHGQVAAVFQGHVHEERFQMIHGTHYITQLGMVDYQGIENNSFSIVELDTHGIHINGYQRASDQDLPI